MGYFNFSFEFGDRYVEFAGYRWAFRVFTPENVYGLDPETVTLDRVSRIVSDYGVDSVFFDIAHFWANDSRYDMYDGTRLLVEELHRRYPGLLVTGEWWYDALMRLMPLVQGLLPPPLYPEAMLKHVRSFSHLSHPAPGRGSSGVHELGFSTFDSESLGLRPDHIPTLAIVEDTFDKYRDVMERIIEKAKEWG